MSLLFYATVMNNCSASHFDRPEIPLWGQPGEMLEELNVCSFVPCGWINDDLSDYSSEIRKETGTLW